MNTATRRIPGQHPDIVVMLLETGFVACRECRDPAAPSDLFCGTCGLRLGDECLDCDARVPDGVAVCAPCQAVRDAKFRALAAA